MVSFRINRYYGCSAFPLQAKTTRETGGVVNDLISREMKLIVWPVCMGGGCLVKSSFLHIHRFQVNERAKTMSCTPAFRFQKRVLKRYRISN